MLHAAGIEAAEEPKFEWMIDTFPILIGLFGDQCPPTTIISQNAYFDPYFHTRLGTVLRDLRKEGYLIIGSGGGTHNLYRAEWKYMLKYKDNFAMETPPDEDSIEFRQALEDVICKNGGGPELRRGIARLMKNPYFREAHGTDEHYISACFVAGAVGESEDRGTSARLGAEAWELVRQHGPLCIRPRKTDIFSHSALSVSPSSHSDRGLHRGELGTRHSPEDSGMEGVPLVLATNWSIIDRIALAHNSDQIESLKIQVWKHAILS